MTKNAKIAKNKTKTEKGNIVDKNSRKKQKKCQVDTNMVKWDMEQKYRMATKKGAKWI